MINHTEFFLWKDPGARFERAAEKQLHEPFEKQNTACWTLGRQNQLKCMAEKAKGRRNAFSYQRESRHCLC